MNKNRTENFSIPDKSKSGSAWERISSVEFSQLYKQEGKSYAINPIKYLQSLYREIVNEMGKLRGSYLFIKTLLWDLMFNKPKLEIDKFDISSKEQKKFYEDKLREYAPIIVFYQTLSKVIGQKKADRLIAHSILPLVLEMMNSKYTPVENMVSIEIFLQQTRNYLGREWEKDKGFSGDVYLSKDKTELWFHITRCAPMQMLKVYGLQFTATAFCMCDHITYHTLFPNLIFRRCHNLASGDGFCDLEFRIRNESDPIMDENNYVDCGRDPEIRELVREWEEKAKEMFFGSKHEWDKYAKRLINREKENSQYIVIQDHTSEYPKPITFEKGAPLIVGEKHEGSEGWDNWYFCESPGQQGGWVPAQVIEDVSAKITHAIESYTAKELNVQKGDLLLGSRTLNGWAWCKRPDTEESGWVPLSCLHENSQ